MRILACSENHPGETRVPLTAATAAKLAKLGIEIEVEAGLGDRLGWTDAAFEKAGARIARDRAAALGQAALVLRLRRPPDEDIPRFKPGSILVCLLDPFRQPALLQALAGAGVTALSLELMPRSTLAQKMDVLSSQANIAGYAAVLLAAERLGKLFPMMMTPAGTIASAKVFVIGAGVAGLQAIATARRLGAVVQAFDTRPVVAEQIKSLGARFVKVDLGETGQTDQGYAKALTEEQLRRQREVMAEVCAQSDVVITAAQVFGRAAPVILTREMVSRMRPGSVVVDLAADTGGNVEGTRPDEEVVVNGVRIIGHANMAGRMPVDASTMYSNNAGALIEHFWDAKAKTFQFNLDDEIPKGCTVVHGGRVVHPLLQKTPA